MKDLAPIILFTYNRLAHTKETLKALSSNALSHDSDLIIYSDAAKADSDIETVAAVRHFVSQISGYKSVTIIERDRNFGLANSIIDGVSQVCEKYGKAIVLEDDIVTSPYFLTYMNEALEFYKDNGLVASIHGYTYPIEGLPETFFLRGADCWGWATWQDRWKTFEPNGTKLLHQLNSQHLIKRFDFNGTYKYSQMLKNQILGINNSWAVRWHASIFLRNQFTLYPGESFVENIGNDGSGTHCSSTNIFSSELRQDPIHHFPDVVEDNPVALKLFENYFKSQRFNRSLLTRTWEFMMRKAKFWRSNKQ